MSDLIDLVRMQKGARGAVKYVMGGMRITRKLENLGIRPGSKIKKVSNIFNRGPVVFSIGDTEIAIGYGMARKIIVEQTDKEIIH